MIRTPHGGWPQFLKAVAALRYQRIDVPGMAGRLRDSGWRADHDDVAGAGDAARHFRPGRSLPAPRQAAPDVCPSCGSPVTDLGLCRCS